MYGKIISATLAGIEAKLVSVETDVRNGLPQFTMVGILAGEVREAKDRVCIAIENSGVHIPPSRITVNLFPADIRKESSVFDLPIAISVLISLGVIPQYKLDRVIAAGELSLNGRLNPVRGILNIVIEGISNGYHTYIVPRANAQEALIVEGITVIPADNLREVIDYLNDEPDTITVVDKRAVSFQITDIQENVYKDIDLSSVKGHKEAKRALEIAVSGMHHLMMVGPPGAGKTMLAKCIPGILPELTYDEQLEITKVKSICGILDKNYGLVKTRPFESPHHSVTTAAMTGGGTRAVPGIITKAHKGVLFLDEVPEFNRDVLETLREPMEEHSINVARLKNVYTYPASFLLVGAMNPCKCGYYPDRNKCRCSEVQVRNYLGRLSRPFMDRIDISMEIFPVSYNELCINAESDDNYDNSEMVRKRVQQACYIQRERFKDRPYNFNSEMSADDIKRYCELSEKDSTMLGKIYKAYNLSSRSLHKMLKVARTIADMAGSDSIKEEHILEAVGYRVPEYF